MPIYRQHVIGTQGNFIHADNYAIITLYILEWPSSWSTSRIRPSCPRSRDGLSLLLVLFLKYISCLLWPTQHLAVCSNSSCFTLTPFLLTGRLIARVQVNNMAALHNTYTDTHIYITLISLSILFFTLLLPSLAGRLTQTLPVWHNNQPTNLIYLKSDGSNVPIKQV